MSVLSLKSLVRQKSEVLTFDLVELCVIYTIFVRTRCTNMPTRCIGDTMLKSVTNIRYLDAGIEPREYDATAELFH